MSGYAPRITASIIARNEQANLQELLPTLRWAHEVLVLIDTATTDASARVAEEHADRVEHREFQSFPQMRNEALSLASGDWVLFVDADERVSDALASESREAVVRSEIALECGVEAPVGYWLPRRNKIMGQWMRGGGWYPDYQLRLMRRTHARYDEALLAHEQVLLDGPDGQLHEPLVHFNYVDWHQFHRKQRRYTELEAAGLRAQGVQFRWRALLGQPLRELWRRYITLGGWRDGPLGLALALAMSWYAFRRAQLVRQRSE